MTLMQEAAGIPAILEMVLIIARLIPNLERLKSKYREIAISNNSKQMVPKIEAYHKRSLSDKFFCVYLDATYFPLRRQTFEREAVYIAIGMKQALV